LSVGFKFRWRGAAAAVGLACVTIAGAAPPSYPASLSRPDVTAWLQRETDIDPQQVVAVSKAAVMAIASTSLAGGPKDLRVAVRFEGLDPAAVAGGHPLSWSAMVELDCTSGRVRLGQTIGYAGRNLVGEAKVMRPADRDWITPSQGAPLEGAWRASCQPGFVRPLGGRGRTAVATGFAPPPVPLHAASAPAPAAAAGTWNGSVQVVSALSEAEARRALGRLRGQLAPSLRLDVEKAVVAGKTRHRGVITGFGSSAQARSVCETLRSGGQACLVRGR
jgi:hypothetical protein